MVGILTLSWTSDGFPFSYIQGDGFLPALAQKL